MSLQGPLIVVTEQGAADLVEALSAAGAFPIVETNWADAATAFVSVKPAAVLIAEPGLPPSESAARMLCLQIATATGPLVATLGATSAAQDPAIPIALPFDAAWPAERIVERLDAAMRVRTLHATVLRRLELGATENAVLPALPIGDALNDATVLVAGRGPLYPALSVAMGEKVKMVGSLSVENAARQLDTRDVDGIVIGDGLSPRMVEAFLTVLSQEPRFRSIPLMMIGEEPAGGSPHLLDIDYSDSPERLVSRMIARVRLHAFEIRLKRMLQSLDTAGMIDPRTGLHARDAFWRDLGKTMDEAADRSQPLSVARYSFDGAFDERASFDAARLMTRLIRSVDFATVDDDGSIFVVFGQTGLREAHVVARRIAGALRTAMQRAPQGAPQKITANVTLATLKTGDTLDTLMLRVMGSRMVAAE
jgi:hypothetical protein